MRTFLRFPVLASVACAMLALATISATALPIFTPTPSPDVGRTASPNGSLWQPAPITSGTVVRIRGRQFVVDANLYYGPIYWLGLPQNASMVASVSLRPADGGLLPDGVSATSITLLAANRPVWRSPLSVAYYFLRPIWLPPYGWGQYQAEGLPVMAGGRTLLARVAIDTGRGTLKVDVPVVVPPAPPVLPGNLTPLASNQ